MAERIHLTATTSSTMTMRRALSFTWGRFVGVLRAFNHRAEVRRLAELDDRALKDIGLTRLDVIGALGEPLHRDPSTVLMIRSVERRSRSRALGVTRAPAGERPSLSLQEGGRGEAPPLATGENASATRVAV